MKHNPWGGKSRKPCTNRETDELSSFPSCSASGRQLKRKTQLGRQGYILCLLSEHGSRWPPAATGNCSWSSETGYSQGTRKAFGSNLCHLLPRRCTYLALLALLLGRSLQLWERANFLPSAVWYLAVSSIFESHPEELSMYSKECCTIMAGILNYTFPSPYTFSSTRKDHPGLKKKKGGGQQIVFMV